MKALKISYKALAAILLFYALFAGFLWNVPELPSLGESIRNLYYHVGMWFSMIAMLCISLVSSLSYLKTQKEQTDILANQSVMMALVFGLLGILTGMIWAKVTWGNWWINDPKLNGAAVTLLCYLAYQVLRGSIRDTSLKARISAVYNILAFAMMVVFMMVLPRTGTGSIHPGQGGNPALDPGQLDAGMRWVFYPAVVGWILLSIWMLELSVRFEKLKSLKNETH